MQEISKIYLSFPTSNRIYDYTNMSISERYEIIDKYNISIIIQTNVVTDLKSLELYANVKLYQPTPSYEVIVLGEYEK